MKWTATPTDWYSDLGLDEAGERAEILHRRAWDWAGHQETGGFVPAAMVARLCPNHTKARVAALLKVGKWVESEGGYQLAEWEDAHSELRSLLHRRKSDVERQRRHRSKPRDADRQPDRDETRDASRAVSRDSHASVTAQSREEKYPPTPRQAGGTCDPISKPHPHCRGCGTTKRALARAEADAAAQADAELRQAAKNAPHCGHPDCDPISRWRSSDRGTLRCPECNEVSILERAQRPQLAVVGAAR